MTTAVAQASRAALIRILEALGVDEPAKMNYDRARQRATRLLARKGAPANLDPDDKAVADALVEEAKMEGADTTAADVADSGNGSTTAAPKPKAKANGKAKAKTQTEPAKGKAKAKAQDVAQAPAEEPAPKPKAKAKAKGAGSFVGKAMQLFRDFWAKRKSAPKADVVTMLVDAGVKPASAGSYIVWAKRPAEPVAPANHGNPWGFQLREEKKGDQKILHKV